VRTLIQRDWAQWRPDPAIPDWSLGVEEEVMLLRPTTWMLAPVIDDVLPALAPELAAHVSAETNASMLELATGVHTDVGDAVEELAYLRGRLRDELGSLGLAPATAGTHPLSEWEDARVSAGARQQLLQASLRELTLREPTFALHVHVGIPERELAVHVLNRMRVHVPLLLALSANSPFLRERETGFASTRTPLFQAFPRVGIPRQFDSYDHWMRAVAPIVDAGAVPESTFFWWDVRLQPRLGTVEIRVMDAQTPEALDENRFLAARDGMAAEFVDPRTRSRVPAGVLAEEMVACTRLYASRLGCLDELLDVLRLAAEPPAERQRALVHSHGLAGAVAAMSKTFCAPRSATAGAEAAIAC
jgi:glutamate---cysteine ligase / carboxylate-amine ligase